MDTAIGKDEPHLIGALLRHGVFANGILSSGFTPLDAAAFAGFTDVVRVLLDDGADTNIMSERGSTPLEGASLKGFDSLSICCWTTEPWSTM
jgi:ankyrin repeat protein